MLALQQTRPVLSLFLLQRYGIFRAGHHARVVHGGMAELWAHRWHGNRKLPYFPRPRSELSSVALKLLDRFLKSIARENLAGFVDQQALKDLVWSWVRQRILDTPAPIYRFEKT